MPFLSLRHTFSYLLIALALSISACTSDDGSPSSDAGDSAADIDVGDEADGRDLPSEAYAWEIPESAEEVDWASFQQMLDSGELISASIASRSDQKESADEQEIRDEQTIEDARNVAPSIEQRIAPPEEGLE